MNEFPGKGAERERVKTAKSDGIVASADEEASPGADEDLDDGREPLPVLPHEIVDVAVDAEASAEKVVEQKKPRRKMSATPAPREAVEGAEG